MQSQEVHQNNVAIKVILWRGSHGETCVGCKISDPNIDPESKETNESIIMKPHVDWDKAELIQIGRPKEILLLNVIKENHHLTLLWVS